MGLLFTYALAYGGSVVALFNPYIGLLIYVCFAIIRPESLWHWSVPAGNYSRIIAVSLLVGWVIRGFGDWRFGRGRVVVACLLGYMGWAALSATQALVPDVAWSWVESQAKVVLPFMVGITLIDSVAKLKQLAWVILLSHGYLAYDFNLSYYNGFNKLNQLGFGGMDNNCVGITLVTCTGLGFFMGMSAPRLWQKALAMACVAFMIHAVLFSFSRGAMLGLMIVTTVSFLLIPKRPIHYAVLVAGILCTLRLAGPEVTDRFFTAFTSEEQRDVSAQSRLDMWRICIQETADNPIFGLGPNHFAIYAHMFGLNKGKHAHTLWLQLAAELGVLGITFLLLFYLICMARLAPLVRESYPVPDPWFRDTARMVIASLTGFMFTAQFVTLPGLESPFYICLLGAGALKLLSTSEPDTAASDRHPAYS